MSNKWAHTIPEDYTEFLYWLKEKTEAAWSEKPKEGEAPRWISGARWIGMTDEEIDGVEKTYGIRFMEEHRQFLKILHAIDRKKVNEYEEKGVVQKIHEPFYFNWLKDDKEIRNMLDWPYREVLKDVLNGSLWLESWGEKAGSEEEKTAIFEDWFRKTPELHPLALNRFLVGDATLEHRPVVSVCGSDIMVYAWSLKHFLLNEFSGELDLMDALCDENGNICSMEYGEELGELNEREYELSKHKEIPFFKEMMSYWN